MGRLVYAEGVALLWDLCRVSLEESTPEAIVREVGARLGAEEKSRVETLKTPTERAAAALRMVDAEEEAPLVCLPVRPVQGQRLYGGADASMEGPTPRPLTSTAAGTTCRTAWCLQYARMRRAATPSVRGRTWPGA